MTIFEFTADGLALPSVIVVASVELDFARSWAETWCRSHSINPETLRLRSSKPLEVPGYLYTWNGDY